MALLNGYRYLSRKSVLSFTYEPKIAHSAVHVLYYQHLHVSVTSVGDLQGVKGKAFPLQAWTGLWGSRRLRLQDF